MGQNNCPVLSFQLESSTFGRKMLYLKNNTSLRLQRKN